MKMLRLRVWAALGLFFLFFGTAQGRFVVTLGDVGDEWGNSVVQTYEGDFLVAGTSTCATGNRDLLLAKFNQCGNLLWTKVVGGPDEEASNSVIETSDKGIVVAGEIGYYDLFLTKFDSSGGSLWAKIIIGQNNERWGRVIESSDGGFVVTGWTDGSGAGVDDMLITKFDSAGNYLWGKTLGESNVDRSYSLIESFDGGLIVIGYTLNFGSAGEDLLIAKFDASGNFLWATALGGANNDHPYSLTETSDSGLVVTGWTTSFGAGGEDVLLVKFNYSGQHIWSKRIDIEGIDAAADVIETSDSGLVVTGYASYASALLLAKFDVSGNYLWARRLDGNPQAGSSVIEASDGRLVVTGYTGSYSAVGEDLLLAKFNPSGETCLGYFVEAWIYPCDPQVRPIDPIVSDWTPQVDPWSPTITDCALTLTLVCHVNEAPMLDSIIGPWTVAEGDTLELWIYGSDPDRDSLILDVINAPANAIFFDSGNGAGSFTFAPDYAQAGVYDVTFIASDGSLADSETVQITVYDVPLCSLFVGGNATCLMPDSMTMPIHLSNKDTLSGMTIPLCFNTDCPGFSIDSVVFGGTRIEYWEYRSVDIKSDTLILALVADMGGETPCLPPGEGPIAFVYYSVECNPENVNDSCHVSVDTCTFQPDDQGLLFVDCDAKPFIPHFEPETMSVAQYRPGDTNGDCLRNLADVIYLLNYLFKDGPEPTPLDAGDANGDCTVDIGDPVYLLNYLFKGGPPPICGCASHPELVGSCHNCAGWPRLTKTSGQAELGLLVGSIESEGEIVLEVKATLSTDVAGVQLEMTYDPQTVTSIVPVLTERTNCLQMFSSVRNGLLKLGLVDLAGKNLIRAGDGSLLGLKVTGSDINSVEITKAVLVDENANRLSVRVLPKSEVETSRPKQFALNQNYPNPFNPETDISYSIPVEGKVALSIYNVRGQKVTTLVELNQTAGHYTVHWDGTDEQGNKVASGIYFYRIQVGEFEDSKKMILMK